MPGAYLKDELYELMRTDPSIFDFLQSGSLDGLWYWNLENLDHEWMNERFWQVLGYDPAVMPHSSSSWQDLIHPEDKARALENADRHARDPDHPYDQIVRYRHRDGSTVWVRCRGIMIRDADGTPKRMLGAHTEVTSLMESRRELEASNRRFLQSNQDLEQFAWAVSHDLRSPLHGIGRLLVLIEEELDDATRKRVGKYMALAEARIDRLLALMDGLLAFARAGGTHAPPEDIAVDEFLDEAWARVEGHQHFDLLRTSTAEPLHGPRALLLQIVATLLDNAVRHNPNDTGQVMVTVGTNDEANELHVEDDGPGIDPEFHERVFGLFEKLQRHDDVKGSGLGLAIAKRAIETIGGTIEVANREPRGTRVTVRWPHPQKEAA